MAKTSRERKFEARGQGSLGFAVEEMTHLPETNWEPPDPSTWPDRLAGDIGIDLETRDEGLHNDEGPGWPWRDGGEVVGYSITADNFSNYLPIGHQGGGNLDPGQVKRWLNHVLSDVIQPKIYANALYDIPWAARDGVTIKGPAIDIQMVEAILDEHCKSYSLENISKDRIGRGKNETLLTAAARAHGYDPKEDLWRLHSKYVGEYGIEDTVLPHEVWRVQKPLIESEGLGRICDLEHALVPMYVDMRRRGVRVDLDQAERLKERFLGDRDNQIAAIKHGTGMEISIWEPESVARVLDSVGIRYGVTAVNKQPSITNELLETTDHWIAKALLQARQKDKLV